MSESTRASAHQPDPDQSESNQPESNQPAKEPAKSENKPPTDSRELVYRGGYSGDPRELIENPAVTPELVEQAPEDLRDDLMPKGDDD